MSKYENIMCEFLLSTEVSLICSLFHVIIVISDQGGSRNLFKYENTNCDVTIAFDDTKHFRAY